MGRENSSSGRTPDLTHPLVSPEGWAAPSPVPPLTLHWHCHGVIGYRGLPLLDYKISEKKIVFCAFLQLQYNNPSICVYISVSVYI